MYFICFFFLVQIGSGELLTGCKLRRNQIMAMLLKKSVSIARSWILLLIQILIPVVFLIISILSERAVGRHKDLPERKLTLDDYDRPVTIVSGSGRYKTEYLNILNENKNLYEDIEDKNVYEYIMKKTVETTATVRQRYILATYFENNTITAMFNNEPYHSPPLAVTMAMKSIVRSKLNSSYNLHLTNYPLPFTINSRVSNKDT